MESSEAEEGGSKRDLIVTLDGAGGSGQAGAVDLDPNLDIADGPGEEVDVSVGAATGQGWLALPGLRPDRDVGASRTREYDEGGRVHQSKAVEQQR